MDRYPYPNDAQEHPYLGPADEPSTSRRAAGAVAVRFSQVVKTYRLDKVEVPALRDVSFDIPQGQLSFIAGPSGSGKSTLLNLMGLIDRPDSGRITLFGDDVTDLSDRQAADFRSRRIGFIFQSFNLLPVLSLRENVEMTLLRHPLSAAQRRERIDAYLAHVGLSEFADRRPGEISGGQRQRVAIARALAPEPDLVIADEPTANLDTRTSDEIMSLLSRMRAELGTTIVVCTHETSLIRADSTLIRVVDGRIANRKTMS